MNYRQGIGLFLLKYNQLSFGKPTKKIDNIEALTYISIALNEINNKYYLAEDTFNLSIVAGTDVYTTGVPKDIHNINSFSLNDSFKTILKNASIDKFRGFIKVADTPQYYTLYKMNQNITLELDSLPSESSTATILYCPKLDIYWGLGTDYTAIKNVCWSDFDETDADFGGSFKFPDTYMNLVIERALCEIFPERYSFYKDLLKEQMESRNYNFNGILPDYWENDNSFRQPGQDSSRSS